VKAADLQVFGQETVVADREVPVLSPDGTKFAAISDASMCITSVSDATAKPLCSGKHRGLVSRSVVWSPDGKYVAFTEGFVSESSSDADLHLFDTTTGSEMNLTEDNVDKLDLGDRNSAALVDGYPSFTNDSKNIVFWRVQWKSRSVGLARISVEGGAVKELEPPQNDRVGSINGRAMIVGETAVYSLANKHKTPNTSGVFALDMSTGKVTTLVDPNEALGQPFLASLSVPMNSALISYPYGPDASSNQTFTTVDLTSKAVKPLRLDGLSLVTAAFSADGRQLLVVGASAATSPDPVMIVRDKLDAPGTPLKAAAFYLPVDRDRKGWLQWSAKTIYLVRNRTEATVFTLG
jgi:dipeptidyl aminopeptidase/acylaminoacyl peptidase